MKKTTMSLYDGLLALNQMLVYVVYILYTRFSEAGNIWSRTFSLEEFLLEHLPLATGE